MMNEKHKKLALYSVGTVLGSFVAFKVGKWLVKKLTPATPLLFMDYINGARKSGVIKAAIDLNVFTHIYDLERASELATVVNVANKCDASPKGIRILLDALAVSGFIEKHCSSVNPDNWYYTLTPSSKKFLVNSSPDYLGCMTNFILHERMTAPYTNFAENVKRGGQIFEQSNMTVENDVWVEFARSVAPMMQFVAPKVADLIVSQRGRNEPMKVLDISAGHGLYGLAFATQNPNATVVAVDWENVLQVALENATKFNVADRFSILSGDANTMDSFGSDFDVALVPNFIHHFDFPTNVKLLEKVYACLKPGGVLVIVEFITNDTRTAPDVSVMFGITMLSTTSHGDAYSASELSDMCVQAGFKNPKKSSFWFVPSEVITATK